MMSWPTTFGPLVDKKFCEIEVSEHSKESGWKKLSEMWHGDISAPPARIIRFWPVLAQLRPYGGQKLVVIGLSGHCDENTMMEWPEIGHANVSWPHSELIQFWPNFGTLVAKNLHKIGVSGIHRRTHGRNGPKLGKEGHIFDSASRPLELVCDGF